MGIAVLFIVLAGISKAIKDTVSHHFYLSIFNTFDSKWWNPDEASLNCYKNKTVEDGELFPLSTSVLIIFTNAWHFFGFLKITLLFVGLWFANCELPLYIGLYALFITIYHLFYAKVFKI